MKTKSVDKGAGEAVAPSLHSPVISSSKNVIIPGSSVMARRSTNIQKAQDGSIIYKRRQSVPSTSAAASTPESKGSEVLVHTRSQDKETPRSRMSMPPEKRSDRKRAAESDTNPSSSVPKRRRTIRNTADGTCVESDAFCWICHRDGQGICCELCPRLYHVKCLGIEAPNKEWICPECEKIMVAENMETRSKAMSLISMDMLCTLLKFVLQRMKYSETDAFQRPVDCALIPTYTDFIFNTMDFSTLEKNIKKKVYGSTEAFVADVKWILHNCIVFNGKKHRLTNVAKTILKICRHETNEVEVCPDCYMNSCVKPSDNWFCEPCRNPHTLVWAKMKGYPFWPAKVLREDKGLIDVRFFGEHDRAWVPLSQIFLMSEEPPTSLKNRKGFEQATEELRKHITLLRERNVSFQYSPQRTPYDPSNPCSKVNLGTTPQQQSTFQSKKVKKSKQIAKARHKVRHQDEIQRAKGVKIFITKISDKPTSIATKTASAVRLKYSSIISTRLTSAKRTEPTPTNLTRAVLVQDVLKTDAVKDVVSAVKKLEEVSADGSGDDVQISTSTVTTAACSTAVECERVEEGQSMPEGQRMPLCEESPKSDLEIDSEAKPYENVFTRQNLETSACGEEVIAGALEVSEGSQEVDACFSAGQNPTENKLMEGPDEETVNDGNHSLLLIEDNLTSLKSVTEVSSANMENITSRSCNEGPSKAQESNVEQGTLAEGESDLVSGNELTLCSNSKALDVISTEDIIRDLSLNSEEVSESRKAECSSDKLAVTDGDDLSKKSTDLDNAESLLMATPNSDVPDTTENSNVEKSMNIAEGTDIIEDSNLKEVAFKPVLSSLPVSNSSSELSSKRNDTATEEPLPLNGTDSCGTEQVSVSLLDSRDGLSTAGLNSLSTSNNVLEKKTSASSTTGQIIDKIQESASSATLPDSTTQVTTSCISKRESLLLAEPDQLSVSEHALSISADSILESTAKSQPLKEPVAVGLLVEQSLLPDLFSDTDVVKLSVSDVRSTSPQQLFHQYKNDSKTVNSHDLTSLTETLTDSRTPCIVSTLHSESNCQEKSTGTAALTIQKQTEPVSSKTASETDVDDLLMEVDCDDDSVVVVIDDDSEESVESTTMKINDVKSLQLSKSSLQNIKPKEGIRITIESSAVGAVEPKNFQPTMPSLLLPYSKMPVANTSASSDSSTTNPSILKNSLPNSSTPMSSASTNRLPKTHWPSVEELVSAASGTLLTDFVKAAVSVQNSVPVSQNVVSNAVTYSPPSTDTSSSSLAASGVSSFEFNIEGFDYSKYTNKIINSTKSMLKEFCQDMLNAEVGSAMKKHLQLELDRIHWKHEQELNEIKHNAAVQLAELRLALEHDKEYSLAELRQKLEEEKRKEIEEVKKKQWCANCGKEAIFYCCWNTSYCNYPCQQAHWPKHMHSCTQTPEGSQSNDDQSACKTDDRANNNPASGQQQKWKDSMDLSINAALKQQHEWDRQLQLTFPTPQAGHRHLSNQNHTMPAPQVPASNTLHSAVHQQSQPVMQVQYSSGASYNNSIHVTPYLSDMPQPVSLLQQQQPYRMRALQQQHQPGIIMFPSIPSAVLTTRHGNQSISTGSVQRGSIYSPKNY